MSMLQGDHCPYRGDQNVCYNSRCRTFQTGTIYGLYDARIGDMFYIGATIQHPGRRYSEHLRANAAWNFREVWIMSVLADGSLPLFCWLDEVETSCELHLKETEKTIAEAWQAIGHTALCDFGTLVLHGRVPLLQGADYGSEMRDRLRGYRIAEYLDRMDEQARILRWLRSL